MKKVVADWGFEKVSCTDFELKLEMPIDSRMLNYLFKTSKDKLKKKMFMSKEHDKQITQQFKDTTTFPVPKAYYKLLRTAITKMTKERFEEFKKSENMKVLRHEVNDAEFTKSADGQSWLVEILVVGQYENLEN